MPNLKYTLFDPLDKGLDELEKSLKTRNLMPQPTKDEKQLWRETYVAATRAGQLTAAATYQADKAVEMYRKKFGYTASLSDLKRDEP